MPAELVYEQKMGEITVLLEELVLDAIIDRFNTKKDIDSVIAMGTCAGQDLANNRHNVPPVYFSAYLKKASGGLDSLKLPSLQKY